MSRSCRPRHVSAILVLENENETPWQKASSIGHWHLMPATKEPECPMLSAQKGLGLGFRVPALRKQSTAYMPSLLLLNWRLSITLRGTGISGNHESSLLAALPPWLEALKQAYRIESGPLQS